MKKPQIAFVSIAVAVAVVGVLLLVTRAVDIDKTSPSPVPGSPEGSGLEESPTGHMTYVVPGVMAFDYPASWSVITDSMDAPPHRLIEVTVGVGGWEPNCHPIAPTSTAAGGFSCGADIWTVPTSGVVVQIYTLFGIGAPPPEPIPDSAVPLPNGGTMVERNSSDRHGTWWLWPPDGCGTYYIEARYGADYLDEGRAQTNELVQSVEWLGAGQACNAVQ